MNEHIKREVAKAPPLTEHQITRLTAIMQPARQRVERQRAERERAAIEEARESQYIKDLVAGRYLTEEGIARLRVLLHAPDGEQ
jgi:Spy/CpxP family protein refolding chaperone